MSHAAWVFPAEWEPQSAVMIAWPHAETDWAPRLAEVERTYVALAAAITRFEPLVVCVADAALRAHAERALREAGVDLHRLRFVEIAYNDTWLRDTGPISLRGTAGWRLLDLRFTGWGGKYEASLDDQLVAECFAADVFSEDCAQHSEDFALEGGAVETDGAGTLLSTWACLQQRHPNLPREALRARLGELFHVQRVEILEHGYLQGDDTDAHIDTLARFAPGQRIVYQACDARDDVHYAPLQAMADELAGVRSAQGEAYRLLALPWPSAIVEDGRRLAASYANYLIVNGAVLMPAYDDPADATAMRVLAEAYPGREIVPVPCRPLIWQNGSLHCITMQLPEGVLHG